VSMVISTFFMLSLSSLSYSMQIIDGVSYGLSPLSSMFIGWKLCVIDVNTVGGVCLIDYLTMS
jgi:hypothetical protein